MEYIFHIGAHRTATTALQRVLALSAGRLARAGVAFWGPDVMRSDGLKGFVSAYATGDGADAALARAQVVLAPHIAAAKGCEKIIISEENLIGGMRWNYAQGALYPDAANRLAAFHRLLPVLPSAVVFTIREFAGYWRSVYAHLALRGIVRDFDAVRLAMSPGNSWLPVLRMIRAAFPDVPLYVMRYDETVVGRLLPVLLGPDRAADLAAVPKRVNAGLSDAALADLAMLPAGPERDALLTRHRARAIRPENPFSGDETTHLNARFAADWTKLLNGMISGVVTDENYPAEVVR